MNSVTSPSCQTTSYGIQKPTMKELLQLAKQLQQGLMVHEVDEFAVPTVDDIALVYRLEDVLRTCHRLTETLEVDWRLYSKAA